MSKLRFWSERDLSLLASCYVHEPDIEIFAEAQLAAELNAVVVICEDDQELSLDELRSLAQTRVIHQAKHRMAEMAQHKESEHARAWKDREFREQLDLIAWAISADGADAKSLPLNVVTDAALAADEAKPAADEVFSHKPNPMADAMDKAREANKQRVQSGEPVPDPDVAAASEPQDISDTPNASEEAMPDALTDTLARLVPPDASAEAKKLALMQRWINLKAQFEELKLPERDRVLPPITSAEKAELSQLEAYMSWFK